nr:receptor-like protein EIX1 [Ziziphus jujuba var. spinosa]
MKWKHLEILNLQNNNLSGVIPSSMGYLTNLFWLQLRNNNLHGEFPLSLRKCRNLGVLDLSENKFIGKIPKSIWISLRWLVAINLRSNKFHGEIPLELCSLVGLQILDLSHNNFSGTIPRCFYNLSAMTTLHNSDYPSLTILSFGDIYGLMAEVTVVTKGREVEYSSVLKFVKSMDLSSNNLSGEIPVELTSLQLQTLNLSNNHLVGKVPSKIGNMRWLESLDLSKNQLSGTIPPSISSLTFLSYLNLSYNNFTGSIPTSTQLQSFNESSFIGNQLCGPPLQQNCSVSDPAIPHGDKQGDDEDSLQKENYLYLSLGLGFAFGFWGVLASLLFNVPWNMAFCAFLDRIVLRLYGARLY